MTKINKELRKWAMEALELGFGCISDGDSTPFVMLVCEDGKQHLINLESASGAVDENLTSAGRELIREFAKTGRLYGLVWDGYLTRGDEKSDAVFIEAGMREDRYAFIFAQEYRLPKRSMKATKIGKPRLVSDTVHLWSASMKFGSYAEQSVYTILHSNQLAAIYDSSRQGKFVEGRKWISAKKLLENARRAGQVVPVIFAAAEDIWELSHVGILEELQILQDKAGKWSTTVSVSNLKKTDQPRPVKTQLVVSSTGRRLPRSHIRPYVLVQTPSFVG
jgi:hypothetical protein